MIFVKKAIIRILILLFSYLLFCPVWHSFENIKQDVGITKTRYGIFNWMESKTITYVSGKPIKPEGSLINIPGIIATIIAFVGMIVFVFIYEKKYLNSNKAPSGNPAPPSS
jgi:hypothetical protein